MLLPTFHSKSQAPALLLLIPRQMGWGLLDLSLALLHI